MDTHRSSEEQEEVSYSDDFEHDMESQDSPFSDEKVEIKVYKSSVGALTVQPKKVSKNVPMMAAEKDNTARTLSELSLMAKKVKPPASATAALEKCGSKTNTGNGGGKFGHQMKQRSRTSLSAVGKQCTNLHRQPLVQEQVDPNDVPASVAASMSSLSISRMSVRNRSATGFSRGASNNIRRVVAHTAIKEKSYASAKYKTYHTPPILRGTNLPPLKAGMAKPITNVAQRVASAKRMTIMDLKSKIKLLQDEIEKLKKENRFLNHLHHRQDNALRKWEGKDAELPRLLNQHKDEIRSLQEQLRRAHQAARDHNEKLAIRDKKILRLENELDKLKALVHEEHLQDRHTLQQDLDITRMNLAGAEKRIREYMRHVDILEKNHKHQLAAQERKLIQVNTNTYELQQVVANLKLALRNKDRMLNYIQMRSSGRTLIRAFHAERQERTDDTMYGTSIQTDLSRPYQPPPLPPIKAHSFDFGNSRCGTPSLEDMRDYEIFSNRFSDDFRSSRKDRNKGQSHEEIRVGDRNYSPRPVSRLSQSLESFVGPQVKAPQSKATGNCCSIALPAPKTYDKKELKSDAKTKIKVPSQRKSPSPRLAWNTDQSKTKTKVPSSHSDKLRQHNKSNRASKGDHDTKGMSHSTKNDQHKSETSKGPQANGVESTELIYKGCSKGFKYEGPFINSTSSTNIDNKKDSTEFLYSPKLDNLSERSLSSTCTSHTASSSRSEEIISNIDILSARIKESCVNVPPPEETLSKSPRAPKLDSTKSMNQKNLPKHTMGPAGDTQGSSSSLGQPIFLTSAPASTSNQTVQVVPQNTTPQGQNMDSPTSQHSFGSPKMQIISLHNASATQPGQFQLSQQTSSPQSQLAVVTSDKNGSTIQFASPRVSHNFIPVQTVNVITEPQHAIAVQQEQLHSPQSTSSRVSTDFSYFSLANNSNIHQEGMAPNPNVTIFQATPPYGHQQHQAYRSPRATGLTNASFNTPQAVLVSPSARNAFPRFGYINSGQVSGNCEQSLPSINSNVNKNQAAYNPSYYVNLGSWK